MKLKATDTLHITAVKADSIAAGEVFEIEAGAAKSLIDRGLATEVKEPAAKAEPAPANKAAKAPANKSS